ncbi:MAG: hypothetical protein ACTSWT_03410 [Candidatus Heimdallarchaeota archaeon]
MVGRTWKNVGQVKANIIKNFLIEKGGIEKKASSTFEYWRIEFYSSTITYYTNETLFSTPAKNTDVEKAWDFFDSIIGSLYELPTKDLLIGLDETGKGEVIGHTVLAGVIFPKEIFKVIDRLVGPANTKKKHKFDYWDELFSNLDELRLRGFDFIVEKIPPWHVDNYNLNKILDVTYQRILSIFLRRGDISQSRVVIDDYGLGSKLSRFLDYLEQEGAEVIPISNAEDKYLEAKVASLVAKRYREAVIKAINENLEFQINGLKVGSGNAGDQKTIAWLSAWWEKKKYWPWFVKKSFNTIKKIDGRIKLSQKKPPPINEELLSADFLKELDKGNLSIRSLSLVCPICGSILKSVEFAIIRENGSSVIKCTNDNCRKIIKNASMTIRYYCGYILPDSNAIFRQVISKDLKAGKFFENFTIILSPVVRKECDGTSRGKKEFEELAKLNSVGRIRLESVGKIQLPDNLSSGERDEIIIEDCLKYNAILLTADKSMYAFAAGRGIFTIYL